MSEREALHELGQSMGAMDEAGAKFGMALRRLEVAARAEQLVVDWHLLRTVGRIRRAVLVEKMGPHITALAQDAKAAGLPLSPAMRVLVRNVRRGA